MTNTEQIRALIAAGETVEKWSNELDRCKKEEPMSLSHRIAEDTYFSVDNSFSKAAANSRQAISEMLEDNERMRVALKEIETYPHSNMDDDNSYAFGQCKEKAKQALKGTDDE